MRKIRIPPGLPGTEGSGKLRVKIFSGFAGGFGFLVDRPIDALTALHGVIADDRQMGIVPETKHQMGVRAARK
jgi:hypothetical protein